MKKCPYCAEEIQDEAIKCRYCLSDLSKPPPSSSDAGPAPVQNAPAPAVAPPVTAAPAAQAPAAAAPAAAAPATAGPTEVRYTHSGFRYVLGYGTDLFGIWDRQSPNAPAERFPRTDEGWRQAWIRFASLEPGNVAVPGGTGAPADSGAGAGGSGWAATPATASGGAWASTAQVDNEAIQYTHSGTRYLLGYGRSFFGIWDRTSPATPIERFSRDDTGWASAWRRYTEMETHYTEVGLPGPGAGGSSGSPGSGTGAPS